uniref:Uncharacterized protein n=1 Tax=Elaeophora elaphi TaxID=1147741 RepID=A0A0R3S4H6_9BILA
MAHYLWWGRGGCVVYFGGERVKRARMDNKKRKQPGDDTRNMLVPSSNAIPDVLDFYLRFPHITSTLLSVPVPEVTPKRIAFETAVLRTDLASRFLYLFPDKFFVFWKHVQMLAGKDGDPCGNFIVLIFERKLSHIRVLCLSLFQIITSTVYASLESLRLCGPFDYLSGHVEEDDADLFLLHDRFETDLPEMQTLAVYNDGRFVYWSSKISAQMNLVSRDEPINREPLIVHVNNSEHFPKCDIIGAVDPFYMIAYLVGNNLPAKYQGFFSKDWIENYGAFIAEVEMIAKIRKEQSVGLPFHGIGIRVPIVNNVGYRPLNEKTGKLKELMISAATTSDEAMKKRKLEKIMEIINSVQFANDERDFGMGLELGHDMFWSNYGCFDKVAKRLLVTAYKLLDRNTYAHLIEIHMPYRRPLNYW